MDGKAIKKVAIVGTVGVPACYGGFESLVNNLIDYQSDNVQYQVFCSSKKYDNKQKNYKKAELIYIPLNANGISSIIYDVFCLLICLFKRPDVTLILGVSGCLFLPIYKLLSKSRIIVNIDGLEWRRNKWNFLAKKFLKKSEEVAVKIADIVISDNQAIANYVEREYGKLSQVIAYGGDHAVNVSNTYSKPLATEEYYLGLCRIEPENNIEMILDAFVSSSLSLKFMGNWNNSEYGCRLKEKYSKYRNINLLEPNYNVDELYFLRKNCTAYLHGHSAGGTNPSLVEAMHFTIPIFAYDCDFNRFTTNDLAVYFNSSHDLQDKLERFSAGEYSTKGAELKNYADEKYRWSQIAGMYELLY